MLYLADTNIFLRLAEPKHPMHAEARSAINALAARGDDVCVVPQNLIELMSVHGITHLLTYNKNHFNRFTGIVVVSPSELMPPKSAQPPAMP